jgi:nitrite reductase/ring-hydroxylating ferredoxin subunit
MSDEPATEASEPSSDDLHYVGAVEDIPAGSRIVVTIKGVEIGVFNVDDEFHAIADYCTHQGGPISEGEVQGTFDVDDDFNLCYDSSTKVVSCPWHGWEFNVETGTHVIRDDFSLITYETAVVDGDVYIQG